MAINLEELPEEAREEIERLRTVNSSMGAYLRLVEGALLAAWRAGEGARNELLARPIEGLAPEEEQLRNAWELAGEVVLRVPAKR